MVNDNMNYNKSVKYMESGEPYNKEWTDALFSFMKIAIIVLNFGRLVMVIMACKWPWLTKYFVYYHLLLVSINWSLPQDYGEYRA